MGPPSNSDIVSAKLLTPGTGFAQDNCGDTFSPKQKGNSAFALNAILFGAIPPSSKVADVNVKTGPAGAAPLAMLHDASKMPPVANSRCEMDLPNMFPSAVDCSGRPFEL